MYGRTRLTKKFIIKIAEELSTEVEYYSAYIENELYGYDIYNIEDNIIEYSGTGYLIEEEAIKDGVSGAVELEQQRISKKINKRLKLLKSYIKHKVPLIYRKPFII